MQIEDIKKYLKEGPKDTVYYPIVQRVVKYLRSYKVSPKRYTIVEINLQKDYECVIVQIDEQCGTTDRRISRSKFEFVNGTVFAIDLKDLPE